MLNRYKITYWWKSNNKKQEEIILALTAADAISIAKEKCSHYIRAIDGCQPGCIEQDKNILDIEALDND